MNKTKVHRDLCELLRQVERGGDIQPVVRYMGTLDINTKAQSEITSWLQRFTPFVFRQREDGKLRVKKGNGTQFNLDGARNTPIWPPNIAKPKVVAASNQLVVASKTDRDSQERLQVQSQRAIHKSVKEFLLSPKDREYRALIEQLEEYKKYKMTVAGIDRESRSRIPYVPVVQGGLPSLGKRAK